LIAKLNIYYFIQWISKMKMSWHFDVTESNCKNGQIWSSWSYWQRLVDSRGMLQPYLCLPYCHSHISCFCDYFFSWQM